MSDRTRPPEALLDEYLDGLLSGAEWDAFERHLQGNPELQGEVECQQAIDATLRRMMSPPSDNCLSAIAEHAQHTHPQQPTQEFSRRLRARRFAVAAALAAGAFGAWQIFNVVRPGARTPSPYVQQPWRSFEAVYHDEVADGFEPAWVCKDDQEFADSFWGPYRQKLLLDELPGHTQAVGLAYCNSITPRTTYLLARVRGEAVLVFVDRIERDIEQPAPAGLHLFRRPLGQLVLYELSPLDEPALLGHFYDPDVDAHVIDTDTIQEVGP